MAEDPLDKKISVEVALTEHGVEASARSRTLAAIDRLCGNAVDFVNIPIERRNQRERAKIEGEKALLSAIAVEGAARLKADPVMADRAIENHFGSVLRAQENKDAVVREAVEQLKLAPPTAHKSSSSDSLAGDFMNRFERLAEEASSDALREKWGRVLASEIRKPGTFSAKAMRIVDELNAETARLFERVCRHRLADIIPKALLPAELNFAETTSLTTAGLLVDPGFNGQIRYFGPGTDNAGAKFWICNLGSVALAFAERSDLGNSDLIKVRKERPAFDVYVLTDVGKAISTILEDNESAAFQEFVALVRLKIPSLELRELEIVSSDNGQDEFVLRRVHPTVGQ